MTATTFTKLINVLKKSFTYFDFDLEDDEMVEIWFGELAYMDDAKAALAVKKVISTCEFVNIKNIKQAYAEIDSPVQVDNEEGWGLVEQAIRKYGYMRAEEALDSLPVQVQKAIRYIGGFQSVCEAENKEVIRGQFNKAMTAVNVRTKANATLGYTLLGQITMYQQIQEQTERQLLQANTQQEQDLMIEDKKSGSERIEDNKTQISHIRDIFNQCISQRNQVSMEVAQ